MGVLVGRGVLVGGSVGQQEGGADGSGCSATAMACSETAVTVVVGVDGVLVAGGPVIGTVGRSAVFGVRQPEAETIQMTISSWAGHSNLRFMIRLSGDGVFS